MRELVRNEGGAALVAQRVFRGHCDRRRYRVLVKARDAGRDAIRWRKVLEWEAATHCNASGAGMPRRRRRRCRTPSAVRAHGGEEVCAAIRIQARRGIRRQRAAARRVERRRRRCSSPPPSIERVIAATVRVA